jgi:hypothetical protein
MIKATLAVLMFIISASFFSPVWAVSSTACVFESSGVDLQKIKSSKHVLGFEEIEKKVRYTGNLKGVGGFYLELFGCNHYGARLTLLLGPDDDAKVFRRALRVVPDLLFAEVDSQKVKKALLDIQADAFTTPLHLADLAKELGLTDVSVQVIEVEGIGLLVFQFYGG